MDLNQTFTWRMAPKLVVGTGCSRLAGDEMRKLGGTTVLVVTDRGIEGAGVLAQPLEGLRSAGLRYSVFNEVEANPNIRSIERCVSSYRTGECDCIVAVGGGSSIDTAKITAAKIANDMDIRDMEGEEKFANPLPPLIAIPTTCGTGAEITYAAVVIDAERHYKFPIFSPMLAPRVSLLDGALLTALPAQVVASTGMDALCHALESYTNLSTNPISDCLDLKAIGMISEWLRPATANANLEAVSNMLLASTIAGMGYSNTKVTIVHAMSHPITGYFGIPHGISNAILLPYVMDFNLIGQPHRFADVARAMGEDTSGLTAMDAARLAPKAVRELSRDVGIPQHFKTLGVSEEHLEAMVDDTFKSGNVALNPVRVTRQHIIEIYRQAIG